MEKNVFHGYFGFVGTNCIKESGVLLASLKRA